MAEGVGAEPYKRVDLSKLGVPQSVKDRGLRAGTQAQLDILTRKLTGPSGAPGTLEHQANIQRDQTKKNALAGLKGYGGFSIGDNPFTDAVETNSLFRNSKKLGSHEREAVNQQDAMSAMKGTESSSFRDKAVGSALGQLSMRAQQQVSQYVSEMSTINSSLFDQQTQIFDTITTLYGEEANWLQDNPKLPSENPEPEATPVQAAAGAGERKMLGPWNSDPRKSKAWAGFPNQTPPGVTVGKPGGKSKYAGKWVAWRNS